MDNTRRDLFKLTGLAGAASLVPISIFADETETAVTTKGSDTVAGTGNAYQFEVKNETGIYDDCKMMPGQQ